MNRYVAFAVTGTAVIAAIGLLLANGCYPAAPPEPSLDSPCEYRTIVFQWKADDDPDKRIIVANPEHLDDVQECAKVIFVNLTEKDIVIVFDENQTGKSSPFADVDEISLEPSGDPNEFSKSFSVAVKLPDDKASYDFPYHVEPYGAPEPDQSPRIRIGPRSVPSEEVQKP